MSFREHHLPVGAAPLPGDVRDFLREAERRIRRFQRHCRAPAFVPSDFERAYAVLHAVAAANLTPGRMFCEWGSGFGVVSCLAAMLDFDAFGIEIEPELIDAARALADDFGLPAEFSLGSFIPKGHEPTGEFAWLTTDAEDAHAELGLDPDDFDVIFAYPWPDEESLTERLFENHARPGSVLVTYHGGEEFRVGVRCQLPVIRKRTVGRAKSTRQNGQRR